MLLPPCSRPARRLGPQEACSKGNPRVRKRRFPTVVQVPIPAMAVVVNLVLFQHLMMLQDLLLQLFFELILVGGTGEQHKGMVIRI